MMKIIVYESAEAPPHMRACAMFVEGGKVLPVVHYGSTPDGVRTRAQAFWEAEQEKIIQRGIKRERRRGVTDPGDVI